MCSSDLFMVKRQCFGLHAAYEVACRTERLFDCKRECNNPLECGNHTCQLPCHTVADTRDDRKIELDPWDSPRDPTQTGIQIIPTFQAKRESVSVAPSMESVLSLVKDMYKDTCAKCPLPCQKKREPHCIHPCPLQCHPGKCPSCSILLKKRCHCPLKTLKVMKCSESHITQT